jgi:HlyD family secretion protein
VDESSIGQIAVGQPTRIVLRSAPATSLPGRIARIGQITDRETREFLVDVSVDALPAKWTVGQRAEVYIETARKAEAICLPQRLISWRKGISGVAIVKDGHAVWRKIAIGLRGNDTAEVTDGLSIGQAVIAVPPGNEPPRDGRAVKEMPK